MRIIKCPNCQKESEHHAKGLCITCYKKLIWKPKKYICKRCKKRKVLHAKGLCPGCYNFVFRSDINKAWNYKKYHNIDLEAYKRATKKCVICGFTKIVELHHIDENKLNNSEENLIGLCPNHHRMFHIFEYKKEIISLLELKGYSIPKTLK